MKINMQKIQQLLSSYLNTKTNDDRSKVSVGDMVEVQMKLSLRPKVQRRLTAAEKQYLKQKLKEGYTKEELEEQSMASQVYKGLVIAIQGHGFQKRIVVRRIAAGGIGVERIIPLYGPSVESVKIVRSGAPRRAKLYYLRERKGRKQLYVRARQKD